jgi:hypothetical protein
VEKILQLIALRTDIITPSGMHYYGIFNEIIGIGIALCASGWIWVLTVVGIIMKECRFLKRELILSQNKIIAISVAAFPIYFLVHKYMQYFRETTKYETIGVLLIFILVLTQSVILIFTRSNKVSLDYRTEKL